MDILIRLGIGALVGVIAYLIVKFILAIFGVATAIVLQVVALVIVLGVVLYALGRWNPKT